MKHLSKIKWLAQIGLGISPSLTQCHYRLSARLLKKNWLLFLKDHKCMILLKLQTVEKNNKIILSYPYPYLQ